MTFKSSDPKYFAKLIEQIDCFKDPSMILHGDLKDNFDSLILSDIWPEEVPSSLIVNSDQQAMLRARSIVQSYGLPHIKSGRFLDLGCGKGHCVIEAAKSGLESFGYDTEVQWEGQPEKGALTNDKSVIVENKPYTVISLYDVIDHIPDRKDAVELLQLAHSVSDTSTKIRVRCHPWTARHGAHLYMSINRAYAHLLLSEEELQKHLKEPMNRITRPISTYKGMFKEAGFKVESMKKSMTPIEPLFRTKRIQRAFIRRLDCNEDWLNSVLPISFIDFILTK